MNGTGLFTTTLQGGTGSIPFDDTPIHYDKHISPITKIVVHSGEYLRSLEVVCTAPLSEYSSGNRLILVLGLLLVE